MTPQHPFDHFRPTRTDNGKGGFTEVFVLLGTIYGVLPLHDAESTLITEIHEDFRTDDILRSEENNV